jgi:hypothetical protein
MTARRIEIFLGRIAVDFRLIYIIMERTGEDKHGIVKRDRERKDRKAAAQTSLPQD